MEDILKEMIPMLPIIEQLAIQKILDEKNEKQKEAMMLQYILKYGYT